MRQAKWVRRVLVLSIGMFAAAAIDASPAQGATIPSLWFASATYEHDASSADSIAPSTGSLTVFSNTTNPGVSYNSTLNAQNPRVASSLGRAGIGWSASTTKTAVTWASNVGASQNDPAPNDGFAYMQIAYNIAWIVPSGTNFGPPMSATFSIPVSGFVGAGGSAKFTVHADWYGFLGGSSTGVFLRSDYNDSKTWLGGTGGQSFFQVFTAPAANSIPNTFAPGDIIGTSGVIRFEADNEMDPVDFGLLGYDPSNEDPQRPNWNNNPFYATGFVVVDAVPLPASAHAGLALILGLALIGAIRRRMALAKSQ